MPNPQTIRNRFDQTSDRYEDHAALEQEVGVRLLERTNFQRLAPERIMDLGCGTGRVSEALKRAFRKAQVIGMDSSGAMLAKLRDRSGMLRPLRPVCSDYHALPFAENSADMVLSNLAIHWSAEPMEVFAEIRRVLKPDGMLLFSTLGPGTMAELAGAWAEVDEDVRVPQFPDLMEIGDALVSAGFREPVMDIDMITLSYRSLDRLFEELEVTGKSLLIQGWSRWKKQANALEQAWVPDRSDGAFPLSFEIIFGTAFGPTEGQPVKTRDGDIATFSVESLRRSRPGRTR